ncbi:endolytic transglycosylase MltG [Rhodophyticola porphyridii]|uniref:Endolytic murein transglycosylase n=1 Tax=Rhodophyticola porphyridii TaxID=1852017 RepID=A0A3L9Y3W7_9RHOB|nr:endolytic transglycosylase MltG [Rhodophyticola porphyridii]RMA42145.1 endolytic transglycosylase MltG [Rhodophyticola porphyridii]
MWKHVAANGLSFLIVAFIAFAAAIGWGQREFTTSGPLQQAIFFEVERGASLRSVSEGLAEDGAISSPMVFRLGADYTGQAGELRFGNYEIPAGASMAEILDIVTSGAASTFRYTATFVLRNQGTGEMRLRERVPGTGEIIELATFAYEEEVPEIYRELTGSDAQVVYRVSVPEGLTSWQIVEGLNQAEFLSGEVPELPQEGMLAPDTYEVERGADRQELLARMQAAQEEVLTAAWEARADDVPLDTIEEALILASIIEKETSVPEERGRVASVFENRLNRGMRLQTDPTVIYGVTNGRGVLGRGIRQSELRDDNPWNTYVIDGLPITPIANPGRAAIEAALNPDETDYVFFVADGTGGHAFAETLEEHNRNVARWRQIEAEREASATE